MAPLTVIGALGDDVRLRDVASEADQRLRRALTLVEAT